MSLILGIAKGGLDEGNHVYGGAGLRHLRFSSHFYILKNTTLFSLQKLPLNNKSEMSKTHYKVKSQLNNISYLNMYIKL